MTERPITFPKTSEDVWTNRETGVRIEKRHPTTGGYKVWAPDVTGEHQVRVVSTLTEARAEATLYVRNVARQGIAKTYVEAVTEHVERAATKAEQAGAPTWRAASARRMVNYADRAAGSTRWLAAAVTEVVHLERWTAEYVIDQAHDEALSEDAERLAAKDGADALVHFWTGFTDVPSACEVDIATTPYTFGSPEWDEVTCKPCIAKRPAPSFAVSDAVVLTDPEGIGIDAETVWVVSEVHGVGTVDAYAHLTGHAYPQMTTASRFSRLAPAPRCAIPERLTGGHHEFEGGSYAGSTLTRCGELRTADVHNTDRARAERVIHAARDHEGAATGTPYGGEWPGTTVIRETGSGKSEMTSLHVERAIAAGFRPGFYRLDATPEGDVETPVAPSDLHDEAAWAGYVATLPAPTPEAMAEVAVEMSTWTAQRRAAVEAFRTTARTIWSLRGEGIALPGSEAYTSLRFSMRIFRQVIDDCDRQNDALRRELTAGSL